MRQITRNAVTAFLTDTPFSNSNMVVQPETDGRTFMYLHGNRIACKYPDGSIKATLAGWPTVTTRERINGLAVAVNGIGVHQYHHQQHLDSGDIVDPESWWTVTPDVYVSQWFKEGKDF